MMSFCFLLVVVQLFLAQLAEGVWRKRARLFLIIAHIWLHMYAWAEQRTQNKTPELHLGYEMSHNDDKNNSNTQTNRHMLIIVD